MNLGRLAQFPACDGLKKFRLRGLPLYPEKPEACVS